MVTNIARRAAPLLAGVLALMTASCDFFFATPFPAMLTMAEKVADLSKYVPKDNDGCEECLNLHLLNGYLFLAMAPGKLVILDSELRVLKEYSGGYSGRLGVFDGAMYYIGMETLGMALEPTGPHSYSGNNRGVFESGSVVTMWMEPGALNGRSNLTPWATPSALPPDFYFEDVQIQVPDAWLLFSTNGGESALMIRVNASLLTGGAFTQPLNENYPVTPLPGADRGRFHLAGGGLVLRNNGSYERRDPFTGTLLDSLPGTSFGDSDRYADAFDPAGEYFYYYDGASKQIYKCRTWW